MLWMLGQQCFFLFFLLCPMGRSVVWRDTQPLRGGLPPNFLHCTKLKKNPFPRGALGHIYRLKRQLSISFLLSMSSDCSTPILSKHCIKVFLRKATSATSNTESVNDWCKVPTIKIASKCLCRELNLFKIMCRVTLHYGLLSISTINNVSSFDCRSHLIMPAPH